jgi:transglutaminase-like putative cysteine protease
MRLRVGSEMHFDVPWPNPAVALFQPRDDSDRFSIVGERWRLEPDDVELRERRDPFGNRGQRLLLPAGRVLLAYEAEIEITREPDPIDRSAVQHPIEELPDEVLPYLLPSRYCLSDELMGDAWELFGQTEPGWQRVQAIVNWVHGNINFRYGSSNPLTTAVDVYESRTGVCRDFAHLAVTFCRAMNVPTRYAFGYLPDIGVEPKPFPMDFYAWMEVYLGDRWWTFDPRNNDTMPRAGRVLIGRGRDALDVAMITTFGSAQLTEMHVTAEPDEPAAAPGEARATA